MDEIEAMKKRQVAIVDNPMPRSPGDRNIMGLFFCDAMMDDLKADFCLLNPGSIRIEFEEGPLIFDRIFQGNFLIKQCLLLILS